MTDAAAARAKIRALAAKTAVLEAENGFLRRQVEESRALEDAASRLRVQLVSDADHNSTLGREVRRLEEALARERSAREAAERDADTLRGELTRQARAVEHEAAALGRSVHRAHEATSTMRHELDAARAEEAAWRARTLELREETARLRGELEAAQRALAGADAARTQAERRANEERLAGERSHAEDVARLREELSAAREASAVASRRVDDAVAEVQRLTEERARDEVRDARSQRIERKVCQ